MKKFEKRLLAVLLCICMVCGIVACASDDEYEGQYSEQTANSTADANSGNANSGSTNSSDTWAIYWYLCGSDLESEGGYATIDLAEMFEVELPENVQVIIETGGAGEWQNEFVESDKICRFLYSGSDLSLLDTQPLTSMGDPQTLYDFLDFADSNFEADHKMLLFWNHGGGSLSGASFDEIYEGDSITLDELDSVLYTKYQEQSSIDNPWFDIIGFDTCLMSTIDVAGIVKDYARYLVASEETEPGNGWYYTGWIGDLASNPGMDGATLGKSICDSYMEGCEMEGTEDMATLAVTDLSKMPEVLEAYDAYGDECLALAASDPGFFAKLYRSSKNSENYGGNTKEQGYTDMVDLGHFAKNTSNYISSSSALISALEAANVYKVNGEYRTESTGLSGYYSYDCDVDNFNVFGEVGASLPMKYLFLYSLTGETGQEMEDYLANLSISNLGSRYSILDTNWENIGFQLGNDGSGYVDLGPDADSIISDISLYLVNIDEENDFILYMGEDKNIVCDWDNGIFTENFYGTWGSLDGMPVYMECTYGDDEYYLYSVPILLNGEEYNLQVAYTFDDGQYYILGAEQGISDSGMASKELRKLVKGDKIDLIWNATSLSGDDSEPQMIPVYSFEVDENLNFEDVDLDDGQYGLVFNIKDAYGNECMTDMVMFDIIDGEIFTSVAGD